MEIHLGKGIDNVTFGMTCAEVEGILGKPNREFHNQDNHIELFWEYTEKKLTLTFYEHKGRLLGYFRSSNPNLSISDSKLIDVKIEDIKQFIKEDSQAWEINEYFSFTAHFYEEQWICLNVKYDRIIDIELGVPFKDEKKYFSKQEDTFYTETLTELIKKQSSGNT
jgi:hypothetical protein